MSLQHIAVATDFSMVSKHAVDVGVELAGRASARLSLVHAYDPLPLGAVAYPPDVFTAGEIADELERDARQLLATTASRSGYAHVERHLLRHPHEAAAICEFVDTQHPELLIVGTHGRSGLPRFLIGSVAEKVVRHASCPVLVTRSLSTATGFPRRVSVCTDLSPSALGALEIASLLARIAYPDIWLVHVEDPRHVTLDAQTRADVLGDLEAQLSQLYLAHFSGPPRVSILAGNDVTERLVRHASDAAADLLVLGTQGKSGLERLLIGSVAERVARHAPCSVLVVRPTAGRAAGRAVPPRNAAAASLSRSSWEGGVE